MKPHLNLLYIGNNPNYFDPIRDSETISLTIKDNSLKAIKHLTSTEFTDAIICDYNLSGNNGLYLYDWIRERTEFNNIPFIIVAKEFHKDIYINTFLKGVNDYYILAVTPVTAIIERIAFLRTYQNSAVNTKKTIKKSKEESYKMPISKRIFDVFVASSVLLLVSPILLLIIAAIRLESPGKVYYTSKRVGRKTFNFYKLRSMRSGSDQLLKKLAVEKNQYKVEVKTEDSPLNTNCTRCSLLPNGQRCSPIMFMGTEEICDYWFNMQKKEAIKNNSTFVKIVDDPRVTRVGKFIRNTSIDELPQLLNVIKGDMSIVGNRPLPVYEAEFLTSGDLSKRFLAPPGITGLWQVELRGQGGQMSEEERIRLDNEYADQFTGDNYSFWYDIKLILRTIPALLQKDSV